MNNKELETLWIFSFNYALGRRTSAPSEFVDAALNNWKDIPEFAKDFIHRKLIKAFKRDDEDREYGFSDKALGDDCDRAVWQLLLNKYYE